MVKKLLCFLQKGNAETMNHFIRSLQESNQHQVAQLLRDLEVIRRELRQNLGQKLLLWTPRLQQFLKKQIGQSTLHYITHKISAVMKHEDGEKQLQESNLKELLEQGKAGGRITIYGEAGSGKTTALHQIAWCWLNGSMAVLESYKYIFLIPLRRARSHSIADIICLDCQLLPKDFRDSVSRILSLESDKVLILLDSYEELLEPVDELEKLISRDLYPQATVLITSRPGSKLTHIEPTPGIRGQLRNFSEEDVKKYTALCSEGNQELLTTIKEKFGMDFVERPINLVMACCMCITKDAESLHRMSQTQLFSQIVVQLLITYIEKTSPPGISLKDVGLLQLIGIDNSRLTGARSFFKEICKQCFEKLREGSQWLSATSSGFTVNDFISFGLFFYGTEPNTVDLPHRLFQEFLAAVYLVLDRHAWESLLEDLRRQCLGSVWASRRYLADVLRSLGLENVIKFVVGLSASQGQEVCSLFGIKQKEVRNGYFTFRQSVYSYELELLQECTNHDVKSAMVEALHSAPITKVTGDRDRDVVNNNGGEQLLDMLTNEQSHQFLAKAYGCVIKLKEDLSGQKTMSICDTDSDTERPFVLDSYVIGCLQKFRCTTLEMGRRVLVVHSDIPVDLLPLLTSGVSDWLYIDHCTLLYGEGNVTRGDVVNIRQTASPEVHVLLRNVRARRPFGGWNGMAPNVGNLGLRFCGDIDIGGLTHTFTRLWRLEVNNGRLVYCGDFRQLNAMRELYLDYCGEVKLCQLVQMFPQLTLLWIKNCQVSWSDVQSQWLSLGELSLYDCTEVRLSQWQRRCPHLECLAVDGSVESSVVNAFCVDDIASQWPSLRRLSLSYSPVVQRGRRLTEEEASRTLKDICPSATIDIFGYQLGLSS